MYNASLAKKANVSPPFGLKLSKPNTTRDSKCDSASGSESATQLYDPPFSCQQKIRFGVGKEGDLENTST